MKINFKNLNLDDLQALTEFDKKVILFVKDWFSSTKVVRISTSGSTGAPKTLEIEKSRMRSSAKMTCDFFNLKEGSSALLCLPIDFISGKMMMVRAIERGLIMEIAEPSANPLEKLAEEVDFCAMTPLQVENSLDKIHLIKNLIIGGAQVSERLKFNIFENLKKSEVNNSIFETYGMSETLSHIALKEIYPNTAEYFTVLDGVEVSQDERGCLTIDAPKLVSKTLQTNDVVELLDKNHFKFLGRTDFVINSGGVKLFPEILENILKKELAKIGIENELVYSGVEDEILGQKLVLFVEGKEESEIVNAISNMEFEKKYHRPKEIVFLEKFPRSENGKILRKGFFKVKSKK